MMQITYYPTRNITVYTVYEKETLVCLNYEKGYPLTKKISEFEPDKKMIKLFNFVVENVKDIEDHRDAIFKTIQIYELCKIS